MNWRLKIALKVILSRLPVPYRLFARAGLFRHGRMDKVDYATSVFNKHHAYREELTNWTGVEIGPGDSLYSAILAKASGCKKVWLIDSGPYAISSVAYYRRMAKDSGDERLSTLHLEDATDLASLLSRCCATYLTGGVISIREIPNESVDFIWSQAVLEHIPVGEFEALCKEMFRSLKPGGVASHQVDFKDHLGGGLNNLRFPRHLWEAAWFARRSGFYTNRIRPSTMATYFERAGFHIVGRGEAKWPVTPIARNNLADEFRSLPEEELLVSGIHFVLKKPGLPHP